jgi:hypothetical protein
MCVSEPATPPVQPLNVPLQQPTATSSLPLPPICSPMSAYSNYNPYGLQSPPSQRPDRWGQTELSSGLAMSPDYSRLPNPRPESNRPQPIPIPMPRSGQRPSSRSGNSPLVGGISAAYTSPLSDRLREDDTESLGRSNSGEQMMFSMDDLGSPSPAGSVYGSSLSSRPRRASTSSERRNSVGHPSAYASAGSSSFAQKNVFTDYAAMSSALPSQPSAYSPYPSNTSGSAHSGLSSLFSRRGSTSSDASSVGDYASGTGARAPYGRSVSFGAFQVRDENLKRFCSLPSKLSLSSCRPRRSTSLRRPHPRLARSRRHR